MGSRTAEPASSPLRHKFVAPGIPRGSIARPRLDRQLSELFDTYSVVEIVAAPGSGKTVQAQLYAASCGRAVAWLTMDRSDRSASGLVFDLATALGSLAGDAAAAMRRTLQDERHGRRSRGHPGQRDRSGECLVVIDECQHIAMSTDAASALDTFLEYIPDQTRVLLLAREELPWPLQKRYVHGQIAQIADSALEPDVRGDASSTSSRPARRSNPASGSSPRPAAGPQESRSPPASASVSCRTCAIFRPTSASRCSKSYRKTSRPSCSRPR